MAILKKDIFDTLDIEVISPDVFDLEDDSKLESKISELEKRIEENRKKKAEIDKRLSLKEINKIIDEKISNIKIPEPKKETIRIQPKIYQVPVETPPQIIRETRVVEKTPQKIIIKEMMKMSDVEKAISEKIKELKKQVYEKINRDIEEKSGILIAPQPLPAMHQQQGKVLSNDGSNAKWIAASSGGGSSSDAYTPSNVTTVQSFDATNTSLDELANVLGSLIASLQGAGVIQ